MSRLTKIFLVSIAFVLAFTTLVLFSSAASAVSTGTIFIGSNDSASRYPLGLEAGVDSGAFPNFQTGGIYQQVYAGSSFSGPVTITQIAFASNNQFGSGPGTATYNFNIALGATAAVPNGLSTNLAANRGPVMSPVFSGPVVRTLTASNQFDLVVDIAPFTYNPAAGNLLLENTMNSPVQFTGGQVFTQRALSQHQPSCQLNRRRWKFLYGTRLACAHASRIEYHGQAHRQLGWPRSSMMPTSLGRLTAR